MVATNQYIVYIERVGFATAHVLYQHRSYYCYYIYCIRYIFLYYCMHGVLIRFHLC